MPDLSIATTTRGALPRGPFVEIKNAVLGKNYTLSLVFIGDHKARTLNIQYRHKQTPANVLSFPLSKHEGEIFLNLARIRREHKKFGLTYEGHVQYLFIHGLLHLKGLPHGSTMDKTERELRKKFLVK
jgi:probable rRNA maturation factor